MYISSIFLHGVLSRDELKKVLSELGLELSAMSQDYRVTFSDVMQLNQNTIGVTNSEGWTILLGPGLIRGKGILPENIEMIPDKYFDLGMKKISKQNEAIVVVANDHWGVFGYNWYRFGERLRSFWMSPNRPAKEEGEPPKEELLIRKYLKIAECNPKDYILEVIGKMAVSYNTLAISSFRLLEAKQTEKWYPV